jgi:hypothetical protein
VSVISPPGASAEAAYLLRKLRDAGGSLPRPECAVRGFNPTPALEELIDEGLVTPAKRGPGRADFDPNEPVCLTERGLEKDRFGHWAVVLTVGWSRLG